MCNHKLSMVSCNMAIGKKRKGKERKRKVWDVGWDFFLRGSY